MSTIKVNNISPQSGNDLNVTGNIIGTGAAGSLSGSFSGSFYGDGTNITGVTGEWDGSHTGNAEITGDLTVTGTLAAGGYTDISSSLHSLEGEALNRDVRLNSLETFSSSLDNYYASEADLSAHSSSIASRVSANETNISALQSFSSSLDATFATDSEVASTYLANANTGSFALSTDVVDLTSSQTIAGDKTFTGNIVIDDANITSTHTSSSLTQNYYRIQFQAQPLVVSASRYVKGNISTQVLLDGSTYTNIYGSRTDIGVYTNTTDPHIVNIGNQSSGSVNIFGTAITLSTRANEGNIQVVTDHISASGDLIISGAITSNQKNNRIRFHYDSLAELPDPNVYHGMFAHVHATGKAYYAHNSNWVVLAKESEVVSNTVTGSFLTAADTGSFALSANVVANSSTGSFLTAADTGSFALSANVVANSSTGSFLTAADTGSLVTLAYVEANYVSKAKILAAATGSLTYNDFTGSLLTLLA